MSYQVFIFVAHVVRVHARAEEPEIISSKSSGSRFIALWPSCRGFLRGREERRKREKKKERESEKEKESERDRSTNENRNHISK